MGVSRTIMWVEQGVWLLGAWAIACASTASVDNNGSDGDSPVGGDASSGGDRHSGGELFVFGDTHGGSDSGGNCASGTFNFFVISLEAIQDEAERRGWNRNEGLGGDLGGLAGADAICQRAADSVGACDKHWVAFLSVVDGGNGEPIHAIDRVGEGPWHDVNGYLVADDAAGLVQTRPDGDDESVVWNDGRRDWVFTDCLTTELGNCNHTYGDSHDTLTGSNSQGRLYNTDPTHTCNDWTSITNNRTCNGVSGTCWPAIGHTWPAQSGQGWIYSHLAGGCQANINLGDNFENGVGGHGGYGGFYCFGLPL
jgi:hypothetical protein